ncbi:copper chaperone [Pseudocyphellaria aurata]|nr:copper chaperone [Pseudocyphellaria aurata]
MSTILGKRVVYTSIACISASVLYHKISAPSATSTSAVAIQSMLPIYQSTFSVPLSCDSCVNDISAALSGLPGIQSTSFSLTSQLVTTTGSAPPSSIISTIQSTGRPAILRGSGAPNSAAVCILELPPTSFTLSKAASPIRGLVRLIQLAPTHTLLDLSLSDVPPGTYRASLRQSGDISRSAASMGALHRGAQGELGTVVVDRDGRGKVVGDIQWGVAEMVGRGIVVERNDDDSNNRECEVNDTALQKSNSGGGGEAEQGVETVVVGVVARSAGAWENSKVVCSCSGKTVWEEREEMVSKGIV